MIEVEAKNKYFTRLLLLKIIFFDVSTAFYLAAFHYLVLFFRCFHTKQSFVDFSPESSSLLLLFFALQWQNL